MSECASPRSRASVLFEQPVVESLERERAGLGDVVGERVEPAPAASFLTGTLQNGAEAVGLGADGPWPASQSVWQRFAASRICFESSSARVSAMPSAGHLQTNSSRPSGGSRHSHRSWDQRRLPPPPAPARAPDPSASRPAVVIARQRRRRGRARLPSSRPRAEIQPGTARPAAPRRPGARVARPRAWRCPAPHLASGHRFETGLRSGRPQPTPATRPRPPNGPRPARARPGPPARCRVAQPTPAAPVAASGRRLWRWRRRFEEAHGSTGSRGRPHARLCQAPAFLTGAGAFPSRRGRSPRFLLGQCCFDQSLEVDA